MSVKTKFTIWQCRSCDRRWDSKPARFTPHVNFKQLEARGKMDDCEKPNVFKITYAVTEMIKVR